MIKTTIKFFLVLAIGFIQFNLVSAQMFYLPDTAFKDYLIARGCGPCITGDSIDSNCSQVIAITSILVNDAYGPVGSLEGIQAFTNLSYLTISTNPGIVVQSLPVSLRFLFIDYCPGLSITVLPPLLETLKIAICSLAVLPPLPNSLVELDCSGNNLTSLPALPQSLRQLRCVGNDLSTIPALPDTLVELICNSNPSLTCLPRLTYIESLSFNNCSVSCLPNYGQVQFSSPDINNYLVCDTNNSNGCDVYWNFSGNAYLDNDSNCQFSLSEDGINHLRILLYENGNLVQQSFTRNDGFFALEANSLGNYSIVLDTANLPFELICPMPGIYYDTLTVNDTIFRGNDFGFKCKSGFDLGAWSIVSTRLRAGNQSTVHINAGDVSAFYGYHCLSGMSATLTINLSGQIQYVGPAPGARVPSSVFGNTITYSIPDINLVDPNHDFVIEVETDTSASIGSEICFSASITPLAGDFNPLNNSLVQCFTVEGSFDPNDKAVYPAGDIDTTASWLTYTVRFQNTGNSYAENIHIIDALDSNLDLSTFQLLSTSHPSVVQILDGGIARFNFPGIFLPDSNANEPESHGYVQYRIRPKPGLPVGSQIQNTAYIYFDFNAPVVTNTTLNTVTLPVGIKGISYNQTRVWPNPVSGQLNVSANGSFSISVRNILGAVVFRHERVNNDFQINTQSWTPGIYFVEINFDNGIEVKKVIRN